ncbi:MAG TPA: hypothetical protein VLT33_46105 [Labilithrix sp.]|nr:hypothetical protein [Labilithrix sp.]
MALRASVVLLAVFAVAVAACSSLPDLKFDDADGGPVGPCVKTGSEICDDGIDNDCNGKTDCADDACGQRFRCVDAAPADWQLTALAEGSRPGCPAGFGDAADVSAVRASSGAPTCGCDCGGASACMPTGIAVGIDNDPSCSATNETLAPRSDCGRLQGNGFSVDANAFAKVTAGSAASCRPTGNGTVPALKDSRTCAVPKVGGGCGGGQVCAPRTSNGYAMCIAKSGSTTCPGSFPTSLHAGTNPRDTRSCTGCTCTTAPCTGEVKLYDSRDCNGGEKLTLTASGPPGACARVTNGSFQARSYTATASGGCVMAAPGKANGALDFDAERTICCK